MSAQLRALALKAESAVALEDLLPSPCSSVCRMSPQNVCEGCLRTLDEIRIWSVANDEVKRKVWRMIHQRAVERLAA